MFIAILLNTASLAMKFYRQPTAYTDFLDVLNQVFTYFFLVECILKLGAFRFKVWLERIHQAQVKDVQISPLTTTITELFPGSLERF